MTDFQLRQPTLGVPQARSPHLIPPEELQLHIDPSLRAPITGLPPPAIPSLNAFSHYTDPPAAAGATSPFVSEINTAPATAPNAGEYTDGSVGVTRRGPGGLDFSAGITGAAGGEIGGRAGVSGQIAPGLRLGVEGGVSGTPGGDGATGTGGIKLTF